MKNDSPQQEQQQRQLGSPQLPPILTQSESESLPQSQDFESQQSQIELQQPLESLTHSTQPLNSTESPEESQSQESQLVSQIQQLCVH